MPAKKPVDIDDLIINDEPITEAIRQGAREAMKRHIMAGVPMVSWMDGKVIEIQPDELMKMLNESDIANS
ncbi:hypothetical protein LJB99_00085 [Deltaproteobacteria bacterium OttesenSCG-928-K17]|nr:hypothetical protein [Deltaproteobacteria bacterium OttesenSCG-928-K17]